MSKPGFYITTAIAYPNNRMHVGFAWEVIGADMVARFQRMKGRPVFFSTGVDEHSQNVEKAAKEKGLDAQAYCDLMAADIQKIMGDMDISYDRFIRTSDPDHMKVCAHLIERAYRKGDVYKQAYEGLYCDSCETFYTEKDLSEGNCPTHKLPVRKVSEENYFFRLSHYQKEIESLLDQGLLEPSFRAQEIKEFVKNGLRDFSVSRTSFKFGVPIPWDPSHVIYVWYDALINYVSAVKFLEDSSFFKKFWPCDVHIVGKDITRFHCVYWPAMLLSTQNDGGEPIALPRKVWAHGFIHFQGEKMSKTRGNIVTPDDVMKDFGTTALRWYLLSANQFGGDGNYSDEDLVLKCNADLSNNIGNLVNRVVSMALKYFEGQSVVHRGVLPAGVVSVASRFETTLGGGAQKLQSSIEAMDLSAYCASVVDFAVAMNKFIDETKPWALAKLPENKDQLETVLAELLEGIRNLALVLWPVIPAASEGILNQLGLQMNGEQTLASGRTIRVPLWSDVGFQTNNPLKLNAPQPLFPRLEKKA